MNRRMNATLNNGQSSSNGLSKEYVLITGGAGFIGTNLADRILSSGRRVMIFDNLCRPGVEQNLEWIVSKHGSRVEICEGDIRNGAAVDKAAQRATAVFHFAAQVAVTTSVCDPLTDFEVNARGTLNVLEALRKRKIPPPLLFTSTNKVYGRLSDIGLTENGTRWIPEKDVRFGIDERRELALYSPYGCSKGAADQYVLDYARTYRLPAIVFRMSCIYGPHQFGNEDQGWVAHFVLNSLRQRPITIYGDGRQVRDVLFVDDLVHAFMLAEERTSQLAGQAFNIGGGPRNTMSLLELIAIVDKLQNAHSQIRFENWRIGDQRYYVSDFSKFQSATGWAPKVTPEQGVTQLYRWLADHQRAFPERPAVAQVAAVG